MNTRKLAGVILFSYITLQTVCAQDVSKDVRAQEKSRFSFGVVADIQYADAEKKGERDYRNSLNKLETCVREFNGHDLSFVISLGDMIDHDFISFDKPLSILENLKAPRYNVPGNHDFEVEDKFKGQVRKRLDNRDGYFNFEVNGMVFIVLDGSSLSTFAYVKDSKKYNAALLKLGELKNQGLNNANLWNGGIGDKQFMWLGNQLEKADRLNKKVVCFCHWPLLPENGTQLWNNREVTELLNKHHSVVAWIAGHHHAGGYEKTGNIHYLILKGMVEAKSETSCGIIEVFSDRLVLKGYGDQKDQIMDFSR